MALAGGVAVCAGFVPGAGGFVPGAGLFVIVGACFVIGGRVAGQGRRQAVFIQRASVFCEVNQGNFRRRGYELIIFAVFVVQIGHAVIPRNIPVLGLGGLHALLCLRFGQAVENAGQSLQGYILQAIRERMERDGLPIDQPAADEEK